MEKIITGWEFWTLVAMVGALFLVLEVLHRGRRMEALGDLRKCLTDAQKEADAIQAEEDERDRRRMVHEADSKPVSMEPFCGEGKKP